MAPSSSYVLIVCDMQRTSKRYECQTETDWCDLKQLHATAKEERMPEFVSEMMVMVVPFRGENQSLRAF
jgi:hypothetical protein